MSVVVGLVVGAVLRVQLLQARDRGVDRGVGGQVEDQRLDLRAQEVVGAARAERGEGGRLLGCQEVQHHVGVGEVADHRLVGRGETADRRGEGRGLGPALRLGQRREPVADPAERLGRTALVDVRLCRVDDPQAVLLSLLRRVTPRGDAVTAEDRADRLRVRRLDRRDVQTQLEAGTTPRHPHHLVAEDLRRQFLAVGGGGDRDPGIGVQVVDVRGIHESVHRGVDRGGSPALAVQAVVERGDHLVLPLDARVDVDERAHAVQPQHREPLLGQGAQVAPGSLDPQQFHRLAGDGIDVGALGRGVAAGVVRDLGVGTEAIAARDEVGGGGAGHGLPFISVVGFRGRRDAVRRVSKTRRIGAALAACSGHSTGEPGPQAPQPAWVPPTRSSAMRGR